ncbi:MAG TPA: M20/M25/M40 family metallo-hydrolase [Methylomirabilota bacterium]|jgi:tripeptide aminopeptidase|nr:M20/M25/M40 family metallo-hydrolase [Methylomirabilota bacterium]
MVTRDRLRDEFLDLVRISSVSRREGEVARRLRMILEGMGAAVEVDDAGPKVGSDTGNLVARFPGSAPDAAPFLLCGHMDTVPPGDNVKPVVDGDVIRSDGTTVLGGDDKSGIVAILEAIRLLRERRVPHGPVEVLLTICEEMGLLGAKQFDVGRLRARTGLILDCDGVHELITRAPAADRMQFTVHGLEAHAGLAPEQGISAVQVAAEAIAAMRLGRVDAATTANIGRIEGGLASNIVPNRVAVRAEARCLTVPGLEAQTRHMRECFEEAAARHRVTVAGREHVARVESRVERDYEPLAVADDTRIVRLVRDASAALRKPFTTRSTGGASDANVFSGRGIEVANLGCGMRQIHTVNEWVDVKDMLATTELLVETVRLHAAAR